MALINNIGYVIFGAFVLGLFIKILMFRLEMLVIWIFAYKRSMGSRTEESILAYPYKGSISQMIDVCFLYLIAILAGIANIYIVAIPTCILSVTLHLNYNKHSKD
ncbi:hypothetical protein N9I85_03415 [Gammaproteobacteria bacterium]|nr:hypothetical protein [Gammaproteobacteria bacterium]